MSRSAVEPGSSPNSLQAAIAFCKRRKSSFASLSIRPRSIVRCAAPSPVSRNTDRKFASPPVPAAFLASDDSFRDQPVDHSGNGGFVKGNQSGKGDLIDTGVRTDSASAAYWTGVRS